MQRGCGTNWRRVNRPARRPQGDQTRPEARLLGPGRRRHHRPQPDRNARRRWRRDHPRKYAFHRRRHRSRNPAHRLAVTGRCRPLAAPGIWPSPWEQGVLLASIRAAGGRIARATTWLHERDAYPAKCSLPNPYLDSNQVIEMQGEMAHPKGFEPLASAFGARTTTLRQAYQSNARVR